MSNLTKRVIAGIIGIPLLTAIVISGGYVLLIFIAVLAAVALSEFYGLFTGRGYTPRRFLMTLSSLAFIVLFHFSGSVYSAGLIFVSLAVSSVTEILKREGRDPLNVFIDISGLAYIALPLSMFNSLGNTGPVSLGLYVFVLIWSCDTFAYFGGRMFGKTPLSSVSPNKTVEGLIAGVLLTTVASAAYHFAVPQQLTLADALVIGPVSALLSQAGDLFESLLKRSSGVKDSSTLIPGHGGVLDRFDSLLFVAPFVYIYYNHIRVLTG